jgi:hypothetical protein
MYHAVCAADPGNACPSVMLVPYGKLPGEDLTPPIRVCAWDGAQLENCVAYDVAANFVYQAAIPPPAYAPLLAPSTRNTRVFAQTAHVSGGGGVWSVFFTLAQTSHWLQVAQITATGTSALGTAKPSLSVPMQITVHRPCSVENCVGCASLSLQHICYAAQQCQLARCIGTMVHQRRPLCAIGMTVQALVLEETAMVQGAWLVISETMVEILSLSEGGIGMPAAVTWPDQAFYGFVCSAKDISATAISVLISSVAGVVQSASQSPIVEAALHTQVIDNRAMAIFTLTSAAVTNFLYQIALAPLYTLLAYQKTMVCTANSVLSTVGVNSITIGDPSIQNASASALGRCMSQYTTENTQGGGTGTGNNAQSIAAAAIGSLSLSVGLEVLMHPLDATFTWLQGCLMGLQDVVETLDRSRFFKFEG